MPLGQAEMAADAVGQGIRRERTDGLLLLSVCTCETKSGLEKNL